MSELEDKVLQSAREKIDRELDRIAFFGNVSNKPFVDSLLDRMVKEGVLSRDFEPPSIEIKPIPFDRISEEDKAARRVPLQIIGTEKADLP